MLKDKTVIVTGGAKGIGKAIALAFANEGCNIVLNYRSTSPEEVKAEIEAKGVKCFTVQADVSKFDEALKLVEAAKEEFGTIDVLVNNAGITRDNLLMRMKDEEWFDIMQTNLTSVFHLSKAMLRSMMKKRFGRIITIGSVVGSMGNPGQSNYCAAKAGLIGFSKGLAKEVASRGITVNVVAPGFIATDMTEVLTEEQKAGILGNVPAGRLGEPKDIAKAVAFLASDDAAYITGTTLHVNGGLYMS